MADDLCPGFEPQTYLKDRCKKCFRLQSKHGCSRVAPRRQSWRERVYGSTTNGQPANAAQSTSNDSPSTKSAAAESKPPANLPASNRDDDDSLSEPEVTVTLELVDKSSPTKDAVASKPPVPPSESVDNRSQSSRRADDEVSFKSARSGTTATPTSPSGSRRPRVRSEDEMSFKSLKSEKTSISAATSCESIPSDSRSMATALSGSKSSDRSSTPTENLAEDDSRAFMRSIKAQLEIMENKCARLEQQNATLRQSELSLTSLEGLTPTSSDRIAQLDERVSLSESMCQDYRDENTVLKCELTELQEACSKDSSKETKQLKDKLAAAEAVCEEYMEENESMKHEIRDLQTEIEELQDQYREEEIDEFRELQRDLEQTAKNCRILQFKLRKSERSREQSEADRQHLEDKIKELTGQGGAIEAGDSRRQRELESELRIAKEVSVRLHNELESLDEKRYKLEDENFYLKEKVRELETREKLMEMSKQKIYEQKKVGKEGAVGAAGSEYNVPQLLRDLQDALERETDVRDQLKFAEDDIQANRKKLSDLETENEGLLRQLAKLTSPTPRGASRPPMIRSASEGQAQIQLELAEHEVTVLKTKMTKMEKENELMVSKMSLLEKEVLKRGGKTEFTEADLNLAVPDTYYKQKIKMLEEELDDVRSKLEVQRHSDEDLSITWRMGRTRPARVAKSRSLDIPDSQASEIDFKKQLALADQENSMLRQRLTDLELKNERVSEENKKLQVIQKSKLGDRAIEKDWRDKTEQMQKDIDRFVSRIAELERQKGTLNKEVDRLKKVDMVKRLGAADDSDSETVNQLKTMKEKMDQLSKETKELADDLRLEKQNNKRLDQQLNEYRQMVGQSESQKLISMASRVEVLNNQLREADERFAALHRRSINGKSAYQDALKDRLERNEKELAEERAKNLRLQIIPQKEVDSATSAHELDKCYDTLVTVETQVDRIYKQLERLETSPKMDTGGTTFQQRSARFQRSTSLKTDSKTDILSDVARVKADLESLMSHLRSKKTSNGNLDLLSSNGVRSKQVESDALGLKEKCCRQEKMIGDLREQLQLSKHDKETASQKCLVATERLLQTEERWNKELEKLRESYENQVKDLKYYLKEAERSREEKSVLLTERTGNLSEKTKKAIELEQKVSKLQDDLRNKHKDLQDRFEAEHRKAKEFETKYQKLEELYDNEKIKLNSERDKLKTDISDLKKRIDEAQNNSEKLKQTQETKQQQWTKERRELEKKVSNMESELSEVEKRIERKAQETASAESKKLMNEIGELKKKKDLEMEKIKSENAELRNQAEQSTANMQQRSDAENKLRKDVEMLSERIEQQKTQLEETRKVRDDTREELSRWQQTWARERGDLAHKLRQDEKVQQAETHALKLKFESRIKITEDTTKTLHAQLAQSRRERDQHRDSLLSAEKKMTETKQKLENEEKEMREQLNEAKKKMEEYDELKSQVDRLMQESATLAKNYETDKQMWTLEKRQLTAKIPEDKKEPATRPGTIRSGRFDKPQLSSVKRKEPETKTETSQEPPNADEALKLAEKVRAQMEDMQKIHKKEVTKLQEQNDKNRKSHRKEEGELQRKIKELQDNIKLLEIDRRNLLSSRDGQDEERSTLYSERDAMTQRVHDIEIHQLANKYKLDKVADMLLDMQAKVRYSGNEDSDKKEMDKCLYKTLDQLESVREDMAKTRELGKALDGADKVSMASWKSAGSSFSRHDSTDTDKQPRTDQRPAPIGSEAEPTATKSKSLSASATPQQLRREMDKEQGTVSSVTTSTVFKSRSSSTCSDATFNNWEQRIAEIRLRSPSPSPRKMTNYPEAPPSIVLNTDKSIEYDKDGKRHWIPRAMGRSVSHDPRASMSLNPEDVDLFVPQETEEKTHARSSSTGTAKLLRAQESTESAESVPVGERSPRSERTKRFANVVSSFERGNVSQKRKFFSLRKSRSVETSEIGRNLASVGMQMLSPGVSPAALPDSLQSSIGSDIGASPEPVRKTRSGLKLMDRWRRFRSRSRSKEPSAQPAPTTETSVSVSVPTTSASATASPTQTRASVDSTTTSTSSVNVAHSWTTEKENYRSFYRYSNTASASSYFRRYGSRRSLSSRFLSRF